MADDLKIKVQLEAWMDENQVKKEVTEVADTAQKTLNKKELKLQIEDNLSQLKKKLEETRVAYQNLLNQPMGWTTDKQLAQLETQMEDLRAAIKSDEQALSDLWVSSSKTGKLLQNLVGKISAVAIAWKALSFLKNTFNDFQQAQKTLVMATGATGDALQELSRDMLKVQWEVAQTQWEIAEAVGELNTRLWLSGQELQEFTTRYLKFASVTGQDGKTAIAENIRMFNIWWVATKDQAKYLDMLTAAWQKTWINVGTLTTQLQQNQAVLGEMWFTLEDSIALLSNFEQAWVEAGTALQAMKIWISNLVNEWFSPAEALQQIVDKIQNAKSNTEAMDIAFQVFWNRWWLAMYNAIRNGTFALDDMKKSLEDTQWAVENTYNEMETLGEFVSRKWKWMVADFVNWNNEWFQSTRKLYHVIKDEMTPAVDRLKNNWNAWKDTISGVIKWERELDIENWKLVYRLTEQWVKAEALRKKQAELNKVLSDYNTTLRDAIDAVHTFDNTKVDDSKTRAEFERDRQSAISAMNAFRNALIAKMQYFDNAEAGWWKSFSNLSKLSSLNRDIMKAKATKFTWKVTSDDGGILWEELFWWSGGWGGGWWSSKSKAEEMAESFKKEMSDLYSEIDSAVSDHQNSYDDLVKSIEKTEKEYDKLRETATKTWEDAEKSIKKYNEQLEENQANAITNLGQRYVELKRDLSEVDSWMKKVAEWLSRKEIEWLQWDGVMDYQWYKLNDLVELKEQLEEMKLIEENTTEEQRKAEEFIKKTSKAQEILNNLNEKAEELESKKAQALEKQAIAQAMMNQENGKNLIKTLTKDGEDIGTFYYDNINKKWEQIHDVENIEYAKQLETQSTNLNDQLAQYQSEKDYEVEVLTTATAKKIQLENEYNKTFQESIAKQKQSVDDLIVKWERLIAKKNEYYWSSVSARAYGWDISNAKVTLVWENWPEQIIARQASYVQPRNAGNSYNTVNNNNSSNLTINWMSNSYGSIDEMLDDLRWRLTYRN